MGIPEKWPINCHVCENKATSTNDRENLLRSLIRLNTIRRMSSRNLCVAKSVENVSQLITLAEHIEYVHGEDKRHACEICTDAFYKKE